MTCFVYKIVVSIILSLLLSNLANEEMGSVTIVWSLENGDRYQALAYQILGEYVKKPFEKVIIEESRKTI